MGITAAIIAAISGAVAAGMAAAPAIASVATIVAATAVTIDVVDNIVRKATPDELEKGWLIIKPRLLLSRLFTFQIHPLF